MVKRVNMLGERGCHFTLAKDPFATLLEGRVVRLKRAAQTVKNAQVYKNGTQAATKLQQLVNFYEEGVRHTQLLKAVLD